MFGMFYNFVLSFFSIWHYKVVMYGIFTGPMAASHFLAIFCLLHYSKGELKKPHIVVIVADDMVSKFELLSLNAVLFY